MIISNNNKPATLSMPDLRTSNHDQELDRRALFYAAMRKAASLARPKVRPYIVIPTELLSSGWWATAGLPEEPLVSCGERLA